MRSIVESILNEILKTSTIRIDRRQKLRQQTGTQAMQLAKERNDPSYKKFKFYRDKMLQSKKQMMKKYKRRGAAIAMKKASRSSGLK